MCTSRVATIIMVMMLITGSSSSPRRTTSSDDFRETATTDRNDPFPESHGNQNRNLPNSGWQSNNSEDQGVTSEVYGGTRPTGELGNWLGTTYSGPRPTREPRNWLGTTYDFRGLSDSWGRTETSTQFPRELSETTTSIWGTTTTRSSLDFTTTSFSSQAGSRHRSCRMVPSPGECQAAFPRYFYNESTSQCDCYTFGGCDEGEGSYRTLEECQKKCSPENKEEGPSCKFVYVNFNSDRHTTTIRTTVPDFDPVNNNGESWSANVTGFRNHSQGNIETSVQEFPRLPGSQLGFSNVTTISPASWSQNTSDMWSTSTSRSTQSTSLATEEPLPSKCKAFSKPGDCTIGSPRYYYNHTSSQCNCYNYTVCGDAESFATLDACVQTCNPILKNQGPSCPVPPIRKRRPTSSFGSFNTSGSDLTPANGTSGSSLSSDSGRPIGLRSPSSSSWNDEEPGDQEDNFSVHASGSSNHFSENRRSS